MGASLFGESSLVSTGAQKFVNTIVDLRAASILDVPNLRVRGYYASGDGGGGSYYYDATDTTSADNGGTIIVSADGGRWKLAYPEGTVSLRQFGFVPGQLNSVNSAAFQRAATWAGQVVANVIPSNFNLVFSGLLLTPGNYSYDQSPVFPDGVGLRGLYRNSCLLSPKFAGPAITVGDTVNAVSGADFSHFTVIGYTAGTLGVYNSWTTQTTAAILLNKCIRAVSVHHINAYGCLNTIQTVNSYQWSVKDCYFLYALQGHLLSDNMTDSVWQDNRADWAEGLNRGSLKVDGSVNTDETLCARFIGGAVQICWGSGIELYDTRSAYIDGILFEANYRSAVNAVDKACADIHIHPGPQSRGDIFEIKNCFFTPGSSPNIVGAYTAIRVSKANNVITSGNRCRDSKYGVFLDCLTGVTSLLPVVSIKCHDYVSGSAVKLTYDKTISLSVDVYGLTAVGVRFVSNLTAGGLTYITSGASTGQDTNANSTLYILNNTTGVLSLRDEDFATGRVIKFLRETTGAGSITVQPKAGSVKTISGAASVVSASNYGVISVIGGLNNWILTDKI